MRYVTVILAVALVAVTASPVNDIAVSDGTTSRNPIIEGMLMDAIEGIREMMVEGSEDFPVLDPLFIENLHLELDDLGIPNSHVTLEHLNVNKLSTFVIDDLSVTMTSLLLQRYTIEIDGYIPVIEIDARDYDLDVTLFGFYVFGAGTAKIKIVEPRIKVNIDANLSILGGISINLQGAHVVFTLGAFEPELTGMFDSDFTNDFTNAFLSHLIPDLVEFFSEEITELLSALVLEIGNDLINGIFSVARTAPSIALKEDMLSLKDQALDRTLQQLSAQNVGVKVKTPVLQ